MKKILITAIAAAFCFCSCMISAEDYIYTIALARETSSTTIKTTDPEGIALVKEFNDAINTISSQNSGDWEWVETIFDGQTSKADAAARKKYDKYNAEVQALMNAYQAKFDALQGKGLAFAANYDFKLYRSLGGNEVLASTKYSVSYGK